MIVTGSHRIAGETEYRVILKFEEGKEKTSYVIPGLGGMPRTHV
jgi:hypothetical protein